MARRLDKQKAIQLRLKGWSYSMIKKELNVNKSTLSNWLRNYPLSKERIRELRDNNPQRIEKYINTRRKKREKEEQKYYKSAKQKVGFISQRELFIAGLFLYWAEGGKTQRYTLSLSNTDPSMIKFFLKWLELLGAKEEKIGIRLHLYEDMDIEKTRRWWSNELSIPLSQFKNPYIKHSLLSNLTYKNGFGNGTCNVIYHNKEIAYLVHQGLNYLKNSVFQS